MVLIVPYGFLHFKHVLNVDFQIYHYTDRCLQAWSLQENKKDILQEDFEYFRHNISSQKEPKAGMY